MKLLLLSHGAGAYGAERVLLAMARGLADRGHDVVLDLPHEGPAAVAAREVEGIHLRLGGRHRLPRNAAEAVGFFATGPVAVYRTWRSVRETDADLAWVNSVFNPWAALGARLSGRPVVWHLHEWNVGPPAGWIMAMIMAFSATRLVTVSEALASVYGRYPLLRGRITTVSNPLVQPMDPVDPDPPGPFTVGCVGQLEPHKRVEDVVRALELVPDARAVLVGEGKARESVASAVRAAGVGDRVVLAGYQETLADQFARFHCVAVPGVREGFGLVALEAMAAGVPVVAARAGALPEVLGDAALYFDPEDPEDLARQIRKLQEDRGLREELRNRGLRRVKGFGEDQWLDRLESMMRDVLEGRG